MLKEEINNDLKKAMLGGDKVLVTVLRTVKSVILDAEIKKGIREAGLEDEAVVELLKKESKKRQDAAEIYRQAGDNERLEKELYEKDVISKYLPEMMSEEAVRQVADQVVAELDHEPTVKDMGLLISKIKATAGASAEGSIVAKIVKDIIQSR